MEAKICIYSKYGKCKKQNCKFHHPEEICCDKTCDIKHCVKKHPQDCRYFWVFNSCRNNGSCKFQHEKPDTLSNAHEKKIEKIIRKSRSSSFSVEGPIDEPGTGN